MSDPSVSQKRNQIPRPADFAIFFFLHGKAPPRLVTFDRSLLGTRVLELSYFDSRPPHLFSSHCTLEYQSPDPWLKVSPLADVRRDFLVPRDYPSPNIFVLDPLRFHAAQDFLLPGGLVQETSGWHCCVDSLFLSRSVPGLSSIASCYWPIPQAPGPSPPSVMSAVRLTLRPGFIAGVARSVAGHRATAIPSCSFPITRLTPRASSAPRLSPFSTSTPFSCANHNHNHIPPSTSTAQTDSAGSSADKYITGLQRNKEWAARTAREHPDLFPTLAAGQKPEILWLGCSDSRCPETSMMGLQPGEVFVHRNIANILHPGDLSSGAVIEYAVQHLRVKHIVVCGHTSCGGVAAAMGNKQLGILDPWLLPLRRVRERNIALLQSLPADEAALKLVELNVRESVNVVCQKNVVLQAIQERGLQVHGTIYDVATGILRELDTTETDEAVKDRLIAFKTEA